MSRLSDMVRNIDTRDQLVVAGPHSIWMETPEEEKVYSQRAIDHLAAALRNEYKTNRVGRFSPSSLGKCQRRVAYSYAGAPQLPMDSSSQEIVDNGTWAHLKWQAEGLTVGYMDDVEYWVEDPDLHVGGSLDATLVDDGGVFELKSCAPSVFSRLVLEHRAPKEEHSVQASVYMMLYGLPHASLVYEDRAYGNFHEFRVHNSRKREKQVISTLRRLKSTVDADELPEPYDDCIRRVGTTYRSCPYRTICHKIDTVTEAREAGGNKEPYQWGSG